MRLFYAFLPDALTRKRLVSAAAQLHLTGRARLVAPSSFHITVAFVGQAADSDLHIFHEMGTSTSLRRRAIDLDVFEYWPQSQAVVLAACKNPIDLATQTDQLRSAVAAQAHPSRDDKPWRAHVTLARKVAQAPVLTAKSPITWVSHSFCLMSSKTIGSESVYTVVDSWPLLDKP